ncbi:MAG: hypothetical protein QXR53_03785 [Candidatus Norongarragalinales archaeon]
MIFKSKVLRFPTLDTVLMIEKAAKKSYGEKTLTQLWKSLPKKVMWQTFKTTIDYLIYSGKILIDKRDNTVIWTWDPEGIEKLKKRGLIIR